MVLYRRSINVRSNHVRPGPTLARLRPYIDLVPLVRWSRLACYKCFFCAVCPVTSLLFMFYKLYSDRKNPNRSNVAEPMSETLKLIERFSIERRTKDDIVPYQYIKNTLDVFKIPTIFSLYQCGDSIASKSRYLINNFMWRHLNPNDRPKLTPLGTSVDVMLHWNGQTSETKQNCWIKMAKK